MSAAAFFDPSESTNASSRSLSTRSFPEINDFQVKSSIVSISFLNLTPNVLLFLK